MADSNNLLVRLHRWAKANRQDENFTTEALVHVLQHLLDHERQIAMRFLAWLTNGILDLQADEIPGVSLKTQVTISSGRPDVEIQTVRHRVFLEAKVEAGVDKRTLKNYLSELDKYGADRTGLILLTRYPVPTEVLGDRPDKRIWCVRWYEIADWLKGELATGTTQDPVSRHTVAQFLGFLSARGMTMELVGAEMIHGVRAMYGFTKMLAEAAAACKLATTPSVNRDGFGLYLFLEKQKYRIGFSYIDPQELWFATQDLINRKETEQAEKAGKGCVYAFKEVPGGYQWGKCLELTSEFFARLPSSQVECLVNFIGDSLDTARKLSASAVDPPATSDPGGETKPTG